MCRNVGSARDGVRIASIGGTALARSRARRALSRAQGALSRARGAFTLVEILIVAFIMMLLAGIALPAVRNTLKDSKKSKNAREVVAFLNEARSRAIATGNEVGVVIPRFGTANDYVRSVSSRMLLSNAVPPYSGETAGARAILFHEDWNDLGDEAVPMSPLPTGATNAAFFNADDCPLLFLSAGLIASGEEDRAPIRRFDRLELQGGRTVVIRRMMQVPAGDNPWGVAGTKVVFDPRERLYDGRSRNAEPNNPQTYNATVLFPTSAKPTNQFKSVRFRIHREPVISSTGSLSMTRGMAIDLNYSGVGENGIQFSQRVIAPSTATNPDTAVDCREVMIVFAPDGSVSYLKYGINVGGATRVLSRESPGGNVYLCLGKVDGVRPDDLLSTEDRATANVMDPETVWVTINASTGYVTASPAASVDLDRVSSVRDAVRQSRTFAVRADSLSSY